MNKEEFIELGDKISKGLASDEEVRVYNQWYRSFQKEIKWREEWGRKTDVENELLERIRKGIEPAKRSPVRLWRISAAAMILLLLAAGTMTYLDHISDRKVPELVIKNDINPGGSKAILTLGDGSKISLDDSEEGVLAVEGSSSISKTGQGVLSYDMMTNRDEVLEKEKYNTISTPQGGQYKVLLPDGSSVWLNALSSIRFPTSFGGNSRNVEITGEVYFDVVHDQSRPFFVKCGDQTVKVLGTEFNINAYEDEGGIETTLADGSVEVRKGDQSVIIAPGQQAVNKTESKIQVTEVNIDPIIAWKDGVFQFWSTDLRDIMRQLSRWYQVEIEYTNEFSDEAFTGFISRDVKISKVLEMLEEAGNIEFGIEDKTVRVRVLKKQ